MTKKRKHIPVNPLAEEFDAGIAIGRISHGHVQSLEDGSHSHRHDYHIFLLAEKGVAQIEIDFEKHQINSPSILYIHPNQVHRITNTQDAKFYLLGINNEKLNAEYLELLEQIVPVKPLSLEEDAFSVIKQAVSLSTDIFDRKEDRLYPSLLKDSCNTWVALTVSQYLAQSSPANYLSRFDSITKAFKLQLERNFASQKRPSDYAKLLSISTPYLNECVRNATGFPVSHHIQQRVILEAKRLLYHSHKSVKEIASELGYDDYAYFSRLFSKVTGMTALTFRSKNLD